MSNSLTTPSAKRGRPLAVHKMANGSQIPGLMLLADGRWRASGPDKFTFTEPDEKRAIARFRGWQEKHQSPNLGKMQVHGNAEEAIIDLVKRTMAISGVLTATLLPTGNGGWSVSDSTLNDEQWLWLREQITARPQWVAERVGIEQIAYLTELQKPQPSPTLEGVGQVYFDRNDISPKEISKARCYWQELRDITGAKTLRELTVEKVAEYGQKVAAMTLSPKSRYHRFNKVKTVLNNYRTTGKALDEIRKALDSFAVIRTPDTTSLDPHPISRKEWDTLYTSQADSPEGKTIGTTNSVNAAPQRLSNKAGGHKNPDFVSTRGPFCECTA